MQKLRYNNVHKADPYASQGHKVRNYATYLWQESIVNILLLE